MGSPDPGQRRRRRASCFEGVLWTAAPPPPPATEGEGEHYQPEQITSGRLWRVAAASSFNNAAAAAAAGKVMNVCIGVRIKRKKVLESAASGMKTPPKPAEEEYRGR